MRDNGCRVDRAARRLSKGDRQQEPKKSFGGNMRLSWKLPLMMANPPGEEFNNLVTLPWRL
jgi:hypothetical protein